jgi:hypothetical protein
MRRLTVVSTALTTSPSAAARRRGPFALDGVGALGRHGPRRGRARRSGTRYRSQARSARPAQCRRSAARPSLGSDAHSALTASGRRRHVQAVPSRSRSGRCRFANGGLMSSAGTIPRRCRVGPQGRATIRLPLSESRCWCCRPQQEPLPAQRSAPDDHQIVARLVPVVAEEGELVHASTTLRLSVCA